MNRYIALKTIVDYGNFSRAADVLGYTQPAVSQMVTSLEKELGVKLLERSRAGAVLTEEGKEIYPYIEQTLVANARIREKAEEVQGLETGTIRIASISSVATHWVPPLIKQFHEVHPGIRFEVRVSNFAGILHLIRMGNVDFAVTTVESAGNYEVMPLKEGRMLAVLPEGHKLSNEKSVRLEDLRGENIILERGDFHEPTIALADLGIYVDNPIDIENDDHAIMSMVEQGLAVSILSELMLKRNSFHIVCLPTDPPVVRKIGAVSRDFNAMPAASKQFLETLKESVHTLK